MPGYRIGASVLLRHPLSEIFEFFALAENLNLLTPPWLQFSILTPLPVHMEVGTRIKYRIKLRGVPVMWDSEITEWDPPYGFTDTQINGPVRELGAPTPFRRDARGYTWSLMTSPIGCRAATWLIGCSCVRS